MMPASPAITAALAALQPLHAAGQIALSVQQGGQMIEVLVLVPGTQLPAMVGLQLLHQSTDTRTPSVWG